MKPEAVDQMVTFLSMYRAVPAMYIALNYGGHHRESAVKGLRRLFSTNGVHFEHDDEMVEFLGRFRSWINFAMADFKTYLEPLEIENFYLDRMRCESSLVENEKCFVCSKGPVVILDVGCGSAPYMYMFVRANSDRSIHYIALDKREEALRALKPRGCKLTVFRRFAEALTPGFFKGSSISPTVLFLSNFLHCFPTTPLVKINNLKNVCGDSLREIKILEPNTYSPLNIMFDLHMQVHSNGQEISADKLSAAAAHMGWSLQVEAAGRHHFMYTMLR